MRKTTMTVQAPKIQFIGSRLVREPDSEERPIVKTPEDAAFFLHERIAEGLDREVFGVICLSPAGHVNHCEIVSVGTIESALADPRAVFKAALLSSATAVILFHNHPTTALKGPSLDDFKVTARMVEAGALLEIKVVDHLIINDEGWFSMKAAAGDDEIDEFCRKQIEEKEEEKCQESENGSKN